MEGEPIFSFLPKRENDKTISTQFFSLFSGSKAAAAQSEAIKRRLQRSKRSAGVGIDPKAKQGLLLAYVQVHLERC